MSHRVAYTFEDADGHLLVDADKEPFVRSFRLQEGVSTMTQAERFLPAMLNNDAFIGNNDDAFQPGEALVAAVAAVGLKNVRVRAITVEPDGPDGTAKTLRERAREHVRNWSRRSS